MKFRQKTLEIRNFRAYKGNYKFDLDADLIVLFGPNGFGKTSFFDAIDFVYTGGVGRFDERFRGKPHRLMNALRHLDSTNDDCFVRATILTDGREISIERFVKNRPHAYINSETKDRTETLLLLAGLSQEPPDLRIDNLVRLFRATHLFGQEYQSLTAGFRDSSKLPGDTVSRMLAFQDYVEAINKTNEVSEELKRKIKDTEEKISFFKASLQSKKDELNQLNQSAKIVHKPEFVLAMGREIAHKISQATNISISFSEEFNKEMVSNWRALVAAQIGSISQDLEVIEKLESKFPELENQKGRFKENLSELKHKKELIDQIEREYSKQIGNLKEFSEKVSKMLLEERNFSLKRDNFNWFLQAKAEYDELRKNILNEETNYRKIQAELLDLLPKIERLKSENKIAEETTERTSIKIQILETTLNELRDFEKTIDDWHNEENRQKELKTYLQRTEQDLFDIKRELEVKKNELDVAIITRNTSGKHLDNLQHSQSELLTLLDNIEKYISSNVCPVCGSLHESREQLIEKLKIQRGIQPKEIQLAIKRFEDAKAKSDELKKNVDDIESKLKKLEQKCGVIQKDISESQGKIKSYQGMAIKLDIPITSKDLMGIIHSKKGNISEQIDVKQQELSEQRSKMSRLQAEFSGLEKVQRNLERDLQTIESKRKQLHSMVDKLSKDASSRQVSLEFEKEMIQRELNQVSNIIEDLHKEIKLHQIKDQSLQKETGILSEKKIVLEREIQKLEKEIMDSKRYCEELKSLLKKLNLNFDIDPDRIRGLKEDFMGKLSYLDSLRNEIINFEIVLDAAQISGALARIQQDIDKTGDQLKDLEKQKDWLSAWLSHFNVICTNLELLRNHALTEYTTKYGPLASNIQKRLRSVYGFGDLGLYPENGGIVVRVERKGQKNVFPTDFFSESQIQIIMLSLFLSAALTQTWSSFAPILLDDPVEHFDDLNAYSFLDLIRGLIAESPKEHQFILSTCDERLFLLMRQKFSKMDGEVIFYNFKSIGENGPEIEKL